MLSNRFLGITDDITMFRRQLYFVDQYKSVAGTRTIPINAFISGSVTGIQSWAFLKLAYRLVWATRNAHENPSTKLKKSIGLASGGNTLVGPFGEVKG